MLLPVALPIDDFTVAVLLTHKKLPDVHRAIVVSPRTLAVDLAVAELSCVVASTTHHQGALLILNAVDPSTLELEVRVAVCVTALSMAELSCRFDVANVPVFLGDVHNSLYV